MGERAIDKLTSRAMAMMINGSGGRRATPRMTKPFCVASRGGSCPLFLSINLMSAFESIPPNHIQNQDQARL